MLHNRTSRKNQSCSVKPAQTGKLAFKEAVLLFIASKQNFSGKKKCGYQEVALGSHFCRSRSLLFLKSFFGYYMYSCPRWWVPVCWHSKEFQNTLEWSITKVYLSGDKLTKSIVICSPLHTLRTGTESSSQEAHACFLSAFIVHETIPKVGWCLKGDWLEASPKTHVND